MQQYYKKDNLEIGLDEAGRGCLLSACIYSLWGYTK